MPGSTHAVDVLDSTISYTDRGSGSPIVFLHGNPGSSHVWRRVLDDLADRLPDDPPARLLAPDLIGMGRSGKPDSGYRFDDHARYLDAWFDALGIDRAVLVGHDWGGALALDRAARLPGRVSGVAFFETVLRPMSWSDLPEGGRARFQALREPGTGERMVLEDNEFITVALPRTTITELSAADLAVYAEPYPTPRSRRPLLAWARSMPVDGDPPDVHARVEAYDKWLATSPDVPKLLLTFSGHPTLMVGPRAVEWCRANIAGLDVVDGGVAGHVAPEDRPAEIAAAIDAWVARHRLVAR
ncbi:haloalkane dehalogenase [Pseudonocardia lacus]|uniref:haloalkane dehalogenase n=1 Tax=Pseudonocardia lacus TaxID=2835865 RepID=UPI001BDC5356|nr:haloalkane dehalogenase [Pseudonocardia lacus]